MHVSHMDDVWVNWLSRFYCASVGVSGLDWAKGANRGEKMYDLLWIGGTVPRKFWQN